MYSADPGEALEEAVRREVQEESGVTLSEVYYHSSQPWPCGPSPQLMLGALGIADTNEIVTNVNEVADARWSTREEVAEALEAAAQAKPNEFLAGASSTARPDGALTLPAPEAIAHHLLAAWLSAPIETLYGNTTPD